jgi:VPDSG-CTERM motif
MVGTFLCSITLSQATTLSFEDLGTATGPVPSNYAGLSWANWIHYGQFLPPFNPGSGQVRLFPQTTTATIQFPQDVTFVGAWLAGQAYDQYFEGYNNGIKLFESSHVANDGSNFGQFFTLNWTGVDEIRFQAASADRTAFDDLEYNLLGPNGVPDGGSTVSLLSFALLGLTALRRKLRC